MLSLHSFGDSGIEVKSWPPLCKFWEAERLEQERQRTEQERQRAEEEYRRAEEERQRAEEEHQRAERLVAYLRAQGFDPEKI